MKKLYSAALVLALSAGSALAADLPAIKGPPPPPLPPPPLWTGFYAGVNAGGTWSNTNTVTTGVTPVFGNAGLGCGLIFECPSSAALAANSILSVNNSGFIGGGQIGYNWQFATNFVAGVETDIQGVASSTNTRAAFGSSGPIIDFPAFQYVAATQVTKRLDYFGTVRGRLGWLFTPTLLVYGTGGLAYGGVNSSLSIVEALVPPGATTNPFFGASAFSDTRIGWTAGAGLEWLFLPNWSAKVEYLYYDLGAVTSNFVMNQVNFAGVPFLATAGQTRARFNGNIVRVGVNYHFHWGAPPVVARF